MRPDLDHHIFTRYIDLNRFRLRWEMSQFPMLSIPLFCVGMVIIALNLYSPAHPTAFQRVVGSAIICVCAIPFTLWFIDRNSGRPFLPLFGLAYAAFFALPIFSLRVYSIFWYRGAEIAATYLDRALVMALVGFVFLLLGYFMPYHKVTSLRIPHVGMAWENNGRIARAVAMLIAVVGLVFFYIDGSYGNAAFHARDSLPIPTEFRFVVTLLGFLSLLGIALLFFLQTQGKLSRSEKIVLWVALVPSRIMLGLGTGHTILGLEPIVLLFMVYAISQQRITWRLIVAVCGLACLVMILIPIRGEFRSLTWGGGPQASLSLHEKSWLYAKMIPRHVAGRVDVYWETNSSGDQPNANTKVNEAAESTDNEGAESTNVEAGDRANNKVAESAEYFQDSAKVSASRLSHLMFFAEAVRLTPDPVPFWGGESLAAIVTKPIPRVIFKNKPKEVTGQIFGHRYGFIRDDDFRTSIRLTQVVELYVNFGLWAIPIGMFMIGSMYRAIHWSFIHPSAGIGALSMGALIFVKLLFGSESVLSASIGVVFWICALVALIHLGFLILTQVESRLKTWS